MARASKAKTARQLTETVNDATAATTQNALHLAAEAGNAPDRVENAESNAELARICSAAADHMAKAQDMLADGTDGDHAAIEQLDAALKCLKNLADAGERHVAEQDHEAKTA
jgi:hypothetical protein